MSITNNNNTNVPLQQSVVNNAIIPPTLPQNNTNNITQPKVQLNVNTNSNFSINDFNNLPITVRLLNENLISKKQAYEIKKQVESTNKNEAETILSGFFVDNDKYLRVKAVVYNVPFIDLSNKSIPVDVLQKLRSDVAERYKAILFEDTNEYSKVAMADPLDVQAINFISTLLGKRVETYFASLEQIEKIIQTKYGAQVGSEVSKALEDVKTEVVDLSGKVSEVESLKGDISSAPVARIVNVILDYAVRMKASDIHIEPRENKMIVRNRIHGVLSEKLVLPLKLAPSIVSRIKILANLKIDEHRIPQDGRFQVKVDQEYIDLRVSILPAAFGEKVVMRLLEKEGGAVTLDKTGLRGRNYEEFLSAIKKTMGIVLVTGPTGSGKTVTLASCLKILNSETVNILTLEDPIEIRIDGVNQVQVNPEVGLTFAKGLRAFLRQDPNIIMIGEIRDGETAELAVQAALTGHLVLATLHTNSSATAMPRLIDMGVEPFLLASTINVAAAQRLVRRVCESCKKTYEASNDEIEKIKEVFKDIKGFNIQSILNKNNGKLYLAKGQGCDNCSNTGYKGRIGIFEVLTISERIRGMIISHEAAQTIENAAKEEGMTSMLQDGFVKVLEGVTTIEEVLRVVG